LIGAGWEAVYTQFFKSFPDYISPDSQRMLDFAADARSAVSLLQLYRPGEAPL
jgi:hypothetical protein